MFFHTTNRLAAVAVAIAGLAVASTRSAYAQGTFADFVESNQNNLLFAKSGTNFITSTDGTTTASVAVLFRFDVANGYGAPNQFINATLTMTGTFSGGVRSGTGSLATEQITGLTEVFTADTAGADGSTNLLTVDAGSGTFSVDGGSGGFQSATTGGDTVTYSSAALDFSGTSTRNLSDAFTAVTPPVDGSTAVVNNNIPNFQASGTGLFAADVTPTSTATPEPASIGMLGLGLMGVGGGFLRRSRRSQS